jgi:transposase
MASPLPAQRRTLRGARYPMEVTMDDVTLIGIDLGKSTFHLHGQDRSGRMVFRKKLTRKQMLETLANFKACTVAMEACGGSHWLARRLTAMGHQVKLIPPQFVKPFVMGHKNDFADAQAICEAACRPNMHFVSPHTEAQQTLSALHRVHEALVRARTCTSNQVHAFLLEFGISLPVGIAAIKRLPAVLATHDELPPQLVDLLQSQLDHYRYLEDRIKQVERDIAKQLKVDDRGHRLLEIPGIGPITASALSIELGDAHQFANARQFAASIGLVPQQHSTGGKETLLGISKRGNKNLRRLLVQCARCVLQRVDRQDNALGHWLHALLARRHSNVVACALANKLARIAWSMLARGTHYEACHQVQTS